MKMDARALIVVSPSMSLLDYFKQHSCRLHLLKHYFCASAHSIDGARVIMLFWLSVGCAQAEAFSDWLAVNF